MKKHLLLFLLIFILTLFGCNHASNTSQASYPATEPPEGVSLTMTKSTYQAEDAAAVSAIIKNQSATAYQYGEVFSLEMQNEDQWTKVPFTKEVWDDYAVPLPSHSEKPVSFHMDACFTALQSGTYRILLPISAQTTNTDYILTAEFILQ